MHGVHLNILILKQNLQVIRVFWHQIFSFYNPILRFLCFPTVRTKTTMPLIWTWRYRCRTPMPTCLPASPPETTSPCDLPCSCFSFIFWNRRHDGRPPTAGNSPRPLLQWPPPLQKFVKPSMLRFHTTLLFSSYTLHSSAHLPPVPTLRGPVRGSLWGTAPTFQVTDGFLHHVAGSDFTQLSRWNVDVSFPISRALVVVDRTGS
jgi:hypothetical protein